jgi:glycosyltransferase involved in cell wall biosynthesis
VPSTVLAAIEGRNAQADHIIAISPFLERMGKARYGDRITMVPLGINSDWYYSAARAANTRLRIVCAGGVRPHKRPQLMLELARRFPHCDFIWYGSGELQQPLQQQAAAERLVNISFPGPLPPQALGQAFRAADLFVLPSKSEGVPKVTQEAAACGLAQVVFGYYEAPSVIDGVNGFVAWDDAEWLAKVAELIADSSLRRQFGVAGAELAQAWNWRQVARQWQDALIRIVEQGRR